MLEGYYSCKYLVGFVERSIHYYISIGYLLYIFDINRTDKVGPIGSILFK
jgi:hypothetical protein